MNDADKLYGGGAAQQPPKQQQESDPGSALYQEQKPSQRFEHDADHADAESVLYGSPESLRSTYAQALRWSLNALAKATDLDPEDVQQIADDASELFADARLAPAEAEKLYKLMARQASAGPADDATVAGWTREARDRLRERFGDSAKSKLEAAQAFVNNRPELAAFLRESGVGSHPDIVMALAENSHTFRMKPRVRKT